MKVEVCRDDGLNIKCVPARVEKWIDNNKLLVRVGKDETAEIDRANFRVFEKWIIWPIWKKTVIRYFTKDLPSNQLSHDDYILLKQAETITKIISQYSLTRQMQLYFIALVAMAVIFAIVLAIVAYRPVHVEVVVPTQTPTETPVSPEQPPILPPPG